jgi:signal transduction histidine kinase
MQHLASRLLDFAHATAVDIQLTPESVDLAQELRATVEVHAADARSRAVTLEVVDGHGAMVTADRIRLRQVLANLVTNAARHAPEGSVAHFALTPAEDRVTLTCANPLGETRPDPDRLFERLYHADRSGTGLGLAIARRLSERMGGELMAAVERDHIRFDLTLPAAR